MLCQLVQCLFLNALQTEEKTDLKYDYDYASAMYHLEYAAKCGNAEALLTLAKMRLGLPHDLLKDLTANVKASVSA